MERTPFTKKAVLQVRQYYRYLVGAMVDKGPGRLYYLCPRLYEIVYYNKTFPVRVDRVGLGG